MMTVVMATPLLGDLDWTVVNDTVMGGVSRSAATAQGSLRFAGELSLERNGGFVSARSTPKALPLGAARALRVTLRGDGRTYDLTLRRSDVGLRAGSYRVKVLTTPQFTTIEVPLSAFRPTSFGRPVPGAPALDAAPERIVSVGFLLADGRPGPFELEVAGIDAVPGAEKARGPGYGPIVAALKAAVAAGVPAFNAGDHSRCRALYAGVLAQAKGDAALTVGERSVVAEALERAGGQADTDAAWTLRHAIDTVLWSAP